MATDFTDHHAAQYRSDGFVVLPEYFSRVDVESMQSAASELLDLVIKSSLALGETNPRLDIRFSGARQVVRKIQPVVDASGTFDRISRDNRIAGPLRAILGCDPVLMEEKLNYKQPLPSPLDIEAPAVEDSFPFHHDWGYYKQQGYPQETLSVAIFVDECTRLNGPLRVIRGSHARDWPLSNEGAGPTVADGVFDHDDAEDIVGPPGTTMVFHSRLVHHSPPNQTDDPRRVMIYSFYPSTATLQADARNRTRRLAAGEFENRYRLQVKNHKNVDSLTT